MLDGITADLVGRLSPWGLLGLVILLIILGRLIPRSWHDDIVRDKNDEIKYLKETLAVETERGRVQGEALGELLEHSRTVDHVLKALPQRGAVS